MAQAELNALIVTNLQDLEGAASHLQNVLQVEIGAAIDELIKTLQSDVAWNGECDWNDDGLWVAPKTWLKPEAGIGDDYLCHFSFEHDEDAKNEMDSFWLSQLVGVGQAKLGFRWSRNDVAKGRWRKAVGQQSDLIAQLRDLGFAYVETNGSFFLPVRVDISTLSRAVADEAPEQALQPLRDAFQRLVDAKPVFDALLAAVVVE